MDKTGIWEDEEILKLENLRLKEELRLLKEKHELKDYLLNNIPSLAWMVNRDFKLIFLNESFISTYESLTGIRLEVGQNFIQSLKQEHYIELWKQRLTKALSGEKLELEEFIQRNGTDRYFKLKISPIIPSNEILGVQVYIQDITQIKITQNKNLETNEKLRNIFLQLQDLYYETGLDGKITELSPAIKNFSMYSREELIGQDVLKLYHNKDSREKLLTAIAKTGKVTDYYLDIIDKDKSIKNISINVTLIRDESGNPTKIAGIIRDITQVEKNNKNLTWFQRAIEHSPISIVILNRAGIIEYVNPFFTKITGYTKDEAIGQKPSILKSGKQTLEFYRNLWKTILSGDTWEGEIYNIKKDGTPFWEHAIIAPVKNSSGQIINFIGIKEDITENKKRIQEIKQLKQLNEEIINTMHEGILVEDKNGCIEFTNPSFLKMTGYELTELIGQDWKHLVPAKYHNKITSILQKGNQKISGSYEIELLKKNQETVPVFVGCSPIIENTEYKGTISVFADISYLKQNEKDLKRALKKARETDKLKSSFLANMSHEIRTPMNAILGFAEILKQEKDLEDPLRSEYFNIIEQKGNELLQIISDIIDISKIEAKIITIKNETIDLNQLLAEIDNAFKKELNLSPKCHLITLTKSLPATNYPAFVVSDKYRLIQVFFNLLQNAKKFTEKGRIEFGYQPTENSIEFFVKDTGIGISKKDQKIIFKRFRQADDNYTRAFGGTGLGLNICKNLMKMLGGTIRVESSPGKGSTFYFSIPRKNQEEA